MALSLATPSSAPALAGTLDRVRPHLSPHLVSPAAWGRVRALAARLPAAITSRAYLETRLAGDSDQVDLIFAVQRHEAALLAADYPGAALTDDLARHPLWLRLRAFCADWLAPGSPLNVVDHLWLEFDVDPGDPSGTPVPGVFVSFGEVRPRNFSRDRWQQYSATALGALARHHTIGSLVPAVSDCVLKLPDSGYLHSFGVMFSRHLDSVRLCISGLRGEDLPRYLESIAWQGSVEELTRLTRALERWRPDGPYRAAGMIHLDVGTTVQGRLGLEYYFDRLAQSDGHFAEAPFVDRLTAAGWCTPEKARALERWPGYAIGTLPHEAWPTLLGRRANHVKLVYGPGGPVTAKAYLFFWHGQRKAGLPRVATS